LTGRKLFPGNGNEAYLMPFKRQISLPGDSGYEVTSSSAYTSYVIRAVKNFFKQFSTIQALKNSFLKFAI
jgi:hypothetical protein